MVLAHKEILAGLRCPKIQLGFSFVFHKLLIGAPRPAGQTDLTVKANLNTETHLSVDVIAYPIPSQYVWYKNKSNGWEQLTNTTGIQTGIQMTNELLQPTLTIRNVKIDDYGEYKLTVNNGIKEPLNIVFVLQPGLLLQKF